MHPEGVHDVVSALVLGEQQRDVFGAILQVSVHDDHDVAARGLERGGLGGLMAEVAGQTDTDDTIVGRGRLQNQLKGPVGASVVDEHHLVRSSRKVVEHRREATHEFGNHRFLVVKRDRDRDPARAAAG